MATGRPRGWIDWTPRGDNKVRLAATLEVLDTYCDHLPLTIRQIYYRLVTMDVIPKTEKGYKNLCELLNRARRARVIPMSAIRDDGPSQLAPASYADADQFVDYRILNPLRGGMIQFDRQAGQDYPLAVWCEAAGMMPMLRTVAHEYGVPVYSSGGFDSLTFKHDMAMKLAGKTVLHVGDYDPSGVHMFSSLEEDVMAFNAADRDSEWNFDLGGEWSDIEFVRLAVLGPHIEEYALPTAPPKASDKRAFNDDRTVQAEAFPPDQLLALLEEGMLRYIDLSVYEEALAREEVIVAELLERFEQ